MPAILSASHSQRVTRTELSLLPTPAPTRTWKPVAHDQVVTAIEAAIERQHWTFANKDDPFDIAVSATGERMFGITQVAIPGVGTDSEFGIAIGFRNSHDQSTALRIAVGANVFICDNMMFRGGMQVRRIHTGGIDPQESAEIAFANLPELAALTTRQLQALRERPLTFDEGIALLATAVERQALRLCDFMDTRKAYLDAGLEGSRINHPLTQWAAYQAVTASYKQHDRLLLPAYNAKLNELFKIN